jgi:hypothetical protein
MQARGAGPVLELPALDRLGSRDSLAMMHALTHGAPLVAGYTGYPPPHADFLARTLARLPDAGAARDLVDAAHVRWLVIAPAASWRSPQESAWYVDRLVATGAAVVHQTIDGFTLLELPRTPEHPAWFDAVRLGLHPGRTVLGAPLGPLPALQAELALVAPPEPRLAAGTRLQLTLDVTNTGAAPWPVSGVPATAPGLVGLVAEWRPQDAPPESTPIARERLLLARDVAPSETIRSTYDLTVPSGVSAPMVTLFLEQPNDGGAAAVRSAPLLRLP